MVRNTKIVIITVCALTIAVAVLAWLNRDSAAERMALEERGEFQIAAGGVKYSVTMGDLEEIGTRIIEANYKTNLMPPVKKEYTGVSLKSVLDYLGVDCSNVKRVSFSASDGYASAASISDALNEDNCFIVFEEAGKPLGTRGSGGVGPYMVIFAKDRFSQRWCKYLFEITISK